jgi:hypothetical protein
MCRFFYAVIILALTLRLAAGALAGALELACASSH